VQDDVERLLEIAAQLFSAIERQIQRIEEDLVCACGEKAERTTECLQGASVLCAESLDTSIHAIDLHLERRAVSTSPTSTSRRPLDVTHLDHGTTRIFRSR